MQAALSRKELPHTGILTERGMNLFGPVVLSMRFILNPTGTDIGIEDPVLVAHTFLAGSRTMALIQRLRAADKPVLTIDNDANTPWLGDEGLGDGR